MHEIINAHSHLIDLEGMIQKYGNVSLPAGISVLEDLDATLNMLHPEVLIAQMDEAGISQSVLYAVEAPFVYASNEYVSKLCDRYPDRFIGFASVDPKAKDAPENLAHAVKNLGLKGLKLHPPLQHFFPDSEVIFPLYEKAAELNIPIVFHVGTTPFGWMCRLTNANPILIDEVAVRFPTLRIMLAHLGTLWNNEAFMVVEKNPNVFIDTAAYLYEIPKILTPDIVTRIGPRKIIFGTDYPMPYADRPHRIKDFVEAIRSIGFPDAIEQRFFRDNFHQFLHGELNPINAGPTLETLRRRFREMAPNIDNPAAR